MTKSEGPVQPNPNAACEAVGIGVPCATPWPYYKIKPLQLIQGDMTSFPEAVRDAVGIGVPCARPYSGIELLQLIQRDHVVTHGICARKHVLVHPGNTAGTLKKYVNDKGKQKLDDLFEDTSVIRIMANGERFLKEGLYGSMQSSLTDTDRAHASLKVIRNRSISIGGEVTRRAVPEEGLESFLQEHAIKWTFGNSKVIVTALYSIKGGPHEIGEVGANDKSREESVAKPNLAVNIPPESTEATTGGTTVANDKSREEAVAKPTFDIPPENTEATTGGATVADDKSREEAVAKPTLAVDIPPENTEATTGGATVADDKSREESVAKPNWAVNIPPESTEATTGGATVAKDKSVEWIIAIEYLKVKNCKPDSQTGNLVPIEFVLT
jgi:hypothetical protein